MDNKITYVLVNGTTYQLGESFSLQEYYRLYATLNSEPTVDTLTYTIDGETNTYEIGAVVRVVDNSSQTGYSFYRLHDITEYNHAIWVKLDMGLLELKETVTVNVTSNQDSDADLIGVALITVNGVTLTYQGEPLVFYVPYNTSYTITASEVTDYTAYNNSTGTYTALYWGARTATIQYCTEIVYITVNGSTPVKAYYSGGYNYIYEYSPYIKVGNGDRFSGQGISSPWIPYKVPYGLSYEIGLGLVDSGYLIPMPITNTASLPTRTVDISQQEITDGVYIVTNDWDIVDPSDWDTADNDNAFGIVILSSDYKILIKKNDVSQATPYDSGLNTMGITTYSTASDMYGIYNGYNIMYDNVKIYAWYGNDDDIYRLGLYDDIAEYWNKELWVAEGGNLKYTDDPHSVASPSQWEALWICLPSGTYERNGDYYISGINTVTNPKTGYSDFGYIGSVGEWKVVIDNKTAVNDALTLIGATTLNEDCYWTINEYESNPNTTLWTVNMYNETINTSYKTYSQGYVVPFYRFE